MFCKAAVFVESEAEMLHFFDQSDELHTVHLVFCSFRERRMTSCPSCTRYHKSSSSIFWPLKCAFDQLTQIPLWVFVLFLYRSSGRWNQLFLVNWFSLSQQTERIKKWNVQHNMRHSLRFMGNWHILIPAGANNLHSLKSFSSNLTYLLCRCRAAEHYWVSPCRHNVNLCILHFVFSVLVFPLHSRHHKFSVT